MTSGAPHPPDFPHAAAFVAVVCRDPSFDPDHPAHEDAIEWLLSTGYARMTFGGPVATTAGLNLYRLIGPSAGWPELP